MNHKTIILADGDFPASEHSLAILRSAERVVCCDHAAETYIQRGYGLPTAIVGDLDSISPECRGDNSATRIIHDPNQENNDLAKAFDYCISQGWCDIVILGATGKREDHTLGNISWLADFCLKAESVEMVTDYGCFTPIKAPGGLLRTEKGMQISFFSFDINQTVTVKGVLYPVENLAFRRWYTATLNEATSEEVELIFSGEPIVVYRNCDAERRNEK